MESTPQNTSVTPHTGRCHPGRVLSWAAGLLVVLCLVVVLLVFASVSIFRYLYHKAPDPIVSYQLNRTVRARMPSWSSVDVAVDESIPVRLSKILEADIPFKQDVEVPINDDFTVPVDLTVSIPIDQEIFVETEVPIEAVIPLENVPVTTSLWGIKDITLPISGTFPINVTIPFKRPVHIKTRADIRIQQEVTVHVNKVFTLPLDLEPHVCLPVDDVFQVSLPDIVSVDARVTETIPVEVEAELDLPKQTVLDLMD